MVALGLRSSSVDKAIVIPFLIWGEPLEQAVVAEVTAGRTAVVIAIVGAALLAADVVLPVPSSVIGTVLGAALVCGRERWSAPLD